MEGTESMVKHSAPFIQTGLQLAELIVPDPSIKEILRGAAFGVGTAHAISKAHEATSKPKKKD